MPKVVVVGDANVDIIVPYPRFLNEERTQVEYPQIGIEGGGTSANTAVALAKLGLDVSFVGTVGDDQYGRFVMQDFKDAGVDVTGLVADSTLSTVGVFAFVDDRGERYLWGWPRERQSFKVLDENLVPMHMIREADWVHSSGMCLTYDTSARETIIRIFEQAHDAGVPTSFDLNLRVDDGVLDPDFAAALERIIPNVDYLLGSGPDEFAYLGDDDMMGNATAYAVDGRTVIVRDGARGSIGLTQDGLTESPAFRVNVEDTIGAGDVYNAGFIAARLAGASLAESLREGNAVSAYKVARRGARSSPDAARLHEFLAAIMGFAAGPIIQKIGRKASIILALACMGGGLIAVAFLIPMGQIWALAVAPCIYYFGTSFFYQPIVDTATLTVEAEESGRALGFNDLMQAITGSVGVAIFGQLMANGAMSGGSLFGTESGPASTYANVFMVGGIIVLGAMVIFICSMKMIYSRSRVAEDES